MPTRCTPTTSRVRIAPMKGKRFPVVVPRLRGQRRRARSVENSPRLSIRAKLVNRRPTPIQRPPRERGTTNAGLLLLLLLFGFAALTAEAEAELTVVDYIESCRKPSGAFGPVDQTYTDAAWNYPAVAALQALGEPVEQPGAILRHGVSRPKGHAGPGHWQFFHQHRLQQLLGSPMTPKFAKVRLVHQGYEIRYYGSPFGTDGDAFFNVGGEPNPDPRDLEAEELGYYNLSSLYYLLAGLDASGRAPANPADLIQFVLARQAPNGGFVDLRTAGAEPLDAETHIGSTFHALAILKILGAEIPNSAGCAEFARSRQLPFEDVYFTWAALRCLEALGQEPGNPAERVAWINSLRNHDGGFGDQPGWRSRLYSTFYAVDSLRILTGGNARDAIEPGPIDENPGESIPDGQFEIFQALFKTPEIAPEDLAGLHNRGFNLLGLKSANFELVDTLRAAIAAQQLPMDIVLTPEAYPHRARRRGDALLHHIANPILAPRHRDLWLKIDPLGPEGLVWTGYETQVLGPLRLAGCLVYPEQDFEMEFAYDAYGSDTGYNAFLAGFNWAPSDFVRVFPWRERYADKLTPIADADAHGDLQKWSPQLDHTRNLFLATDPSYAAFREAARLGRVVCVIPDPEGAERPAIYGPAAAAAYVRARIGEWKWW